MKSVIKKIGSWWDPGKPIRTLLNQAREKLPGDTPNPVIDEETDEYRLEHYDDFIEHTEWELALGVLIYIADACEEDAQQVPTDFWNDLLKASVMMDLNKQAETCQARIDRANHRLQLTGCARD